MKLFLLIAALLQTPTPPAGVRVSGRVVDGETGKPLPDVVVTLSNLSANTSKRTVTTGPNGTFQFSSVQRGAYRLETAHPKPVVAYRSESLEIEITNRDLENLGLILSPAVPRVLISGKVGMAGGGPLPVAISGLKLSYEVIPIQRDGSFEARVRLPERYDLGIQSPPEGYFVESVSAGTWDQDAGTWYLRDKPPTAVQITLNVGRQRIAGRILSAKKLPAPRANVILIGPSPSKATRPIVPGSGGTFSLGGIRPGDYELRATDGVGDAAEAASLQFSVGAQNREDIDLILRVRIPITGQVLVTAPRTIEDLMRFKPYIEVDDALGKSKVPIDARGTFQFRSFEGAYTLTIKELPLEFRVQSIASGSSTVTVRVGTMQGDAPDFFRFNTRPPRR